MPITPSRPIFSISLFHSHVRANPNGGIDQLLSMGMGNLNQGNSSGDNRLTLVLVSIEILKYCFGVDGGTLDHRYYSETRAAWYFTGTLNYPFPGVQNKLGGYLGFVQKDGHNFEIVARNVDGSLWGVSWSPPPLLGKVNRMLHSGIVPRSTKTALFHVPIHGLGPCHNPAIRPRTGAIQRKSRDLNETDSAGHVYVVALLASGQMQIFYRPSSNKPSCHCSLNKTWIPTEVFGSGIGNTAPVMVQDYWRTQNGNKWGGFQLLVAANGQVQHWQRVNTDIISNPPRDSGKFSPFPANCSFSGGIKADN
jgi:hypothetical protein